MYAAMSDSSADDLQSLPETILSVAGHTKMLHVGSGAGHLVRELLALGMDAYGVDNAPNAVEYANSFLSGRVSQGSVHSLPFDENAFPLVVSTQTLDRLVETDIDPALKEIWRVCAGTFF